MAKPERVNLINIFGLAYSLHMLGQMPNGWKILNVNNETMYVTKKTWKKSFIILRWAVKAVTINPEAIKILCDIKFHSIIHKNTN